MGNVLLIAGNAFRETLSMKLVYAVLMLGFGLILLLTLPMSYYEFALDAGDENLLEFIVYYFVQILLNGFWLVSFVLALMLGSMAVPGEIKRRTVVTILARPIERWQYLLGRWLGIAAFLVIVQTVGMLMSAALVYYLQIFPSTLIAVSIAQSYVSVLLCLTVALALGAILSTASSFALTVVLLVVLPEVVDGAARSPYAIVRNTMDIIARVVPARIPGDPLQESFTMTALNTDYTLYAQVLAENALYGLAIFCIGALVFSRRQIIAGS